MGVERTTVVVNVEGEQQAAAAARRLEATADRVSAKADRAKAKVREADLAGRKMSLFQSALRKGKGEFGPVEMGPQGFAINRGWLSGRGAGAVAGPLLATYAVQRGAEGITNAGNQIADFMQDGETFAEVLKRAPARISRQIGEYAVAPSVKLAGMITRFTAGYTAEQSEMAQGELMANAFRRYSPIDQAIDAQKLQAREAAKIRRQQDVEDAAAAAKKRSALDAALEKMDQALAAKLAGMRAPQLPIRVPDAMWHEMQQAAKERERRRAEIVKQRISAGAGS